MKNIVYCADCGGIINTATEIFRIEWANGIIRIVHFDCGFANERLDYADVIVGQESYKDSQTVRWRLELLKDNPAYEKSAQMVLQELFD